MPESGKSDRWKSLLDTLGVPVSEPVGKAPEAILAGAGETPAESPSPATAKPQPISMLRPEKPKAAPKPKPAPPAAKSPSYWSRIAGALGLEVPPEPLKEPTVQRAEEPKVEPSPVETRARAPLDDIFAPPSVDTEVMRPIEGRPEPRMREAPVQRDRPEEERGPVLEFGDDGGLDLPLGEARERETRPRAEEGPEREGRRRRRRRGRRGRGEGRETAAPRREAEIEPAGEEVDLDYEREVELDIGPAEEAPRHDERLHREPREEYPPRQEREERGGRGRRPRRRGPSRADEREEIARERPTSYEPEEVEEDLRHERPAAELRPAQYEEEVDEQDLGEHDEGDEEHGGGLPTHKKIPTWEEAVGILIEANMAARAASPDRDRGRGYGRGRGRGR